MARWLARTAAPHPTVNGAAVPGDRPEALPVAVVIPCFNDGATVGEAVASVLNESPAEVVIVNDGSTDPHTLEVLDALGVASARVVHQANAGLAAARMRGVAETTSPFVMVLDADDCVAEGALAAMAEALMADQSLAVVWGDVERFGDAGHLVYPKARSLDPWRISLLNELVASSMVRRSSLLEAGGWTLTDAYEDWDLWMAMAERGMHGRHVGRVTLRYRVADPRMYASALGRHDELVRALEERHPGLLMNRSRNRRASASGYMLKAAWGIISRLPLPPRFARYCYVGSLWAFEPSRRRRR